MHVHVHVCCTYSTLNTCVSLKSALGIPGMLRMVLAIIGSLRSSSFTCSGFQCFHHPPAFMWTHNIMSAQPIAVCILFCECLFIHHGCMHSIVLCFSIYICRTFYAPQNCYNASYFRVQDTSIHVASSSIGLHYSNIDLSH